MLGSTPPAGTGSIGGALWWVSTVSTPSIASAAAVSMAVIVARAVVLKTGTA